MKVLGIAGSPRRNGNSETLLDKVLEGASSKGALVEKVVINELDIKPCQGENICFKDGRCYIGDDMVELYDKLKTYDAVVVASPVYFGSVPAQLKAAIDRCQAVWVENFILKKRTSKVFKRKGMLILVSAHPGKKFFKNPEGIIQLFFKVIGVNFHKKLYVPGMESAGDILKNKDILNEAFRYGAELVK